MWLAKRLALAERVERRSERREAGLWVYLHQYTIELVGVFHVLCRRHELDIVPFGQGRRGE